ncbi:FAD-dependent monooxygenase [Kitasatospora sp. NBC_01246]|uniref:NAD(P)/FAD-dependent oxidoreductase n=1 Tax=Kitasatospora sp. NBC_01246 TaxID=2903570 RepID=UPI002E337FC8|nr:FAD-dependent monooxygenase [Kitasatospora sp. NBC_01246]
MSTAVVLGGGLAGLLAAAALEPHARRVTVVEQDTLPDGPHPRRGLPQGDFSHILLGGGADALDALLPGTVDALLAAGAHRRPMPSGMLMRLGPGWLQAFESTAYLIACSRHLLDHIVRQRLRGRAAVTIREGTSVLGLTGDAAQVRGALVRNPDGSRETLPADLVVDATGRRSQAPRWLRALGSTGPREVTVDAGLAYAARLFDAPRGNQGFPVVSIVPVPGRRTPGRGATVVPIENDRWIITLSGTRAGEPSRTEAEFHTFLKGLTHPVVHDLARAARPVGPIRTCRGTLNRRRCYESGTPAGFAATGDALAALNPVYGHGMAVAAQCAVAIRTTLDAEGLHPHVSATVQRRIARAVDTPWKMAEEQDRDFPGARSNEPPAQRPTARLGRWYTERLLRAALTDPAVSAAYFDVFSLAAPADRLTSPAVALATLRPRRTVPPTLGEAIARFPRVAELTGPY